VRTRFGCHSEEFPWACGPPQAMKVRRESLVMKNSATCQEEKNLIVISPPDFQESRRRRGISQCVENIQSEIPRSARNDSPFFHSFSVAGTPPHVGAHGHAPVPLSACARRVWGEGLPSPRRPRAGAGDGKPSPYIARRYRGIREASISFARPTRKRETYRLECPHCREARDPAY
jgi:hypothetical protein